MSAFSAVFFIVFTSAWLVGVVAWFYALFHFVMAAYVRWSALPEGERLRGFLWPPIKDVSTDYIPPLEWLEHKNKVRRAVVVFFVAWSFGMTMGFIADALGKMK